MPRPEPSPKDGCLRPACVCCLRPACVCCLRPACVCCLRPACVCYLRPAHAHACCPTPISMTPKTKNFITPNWPVPGDVKAFCTTRTGGISAAPYANFNLGDHVGDAPEAVLENRQRLQQNAGLSASPQWLQQIHSDRIIAAGAIAGQPEADAIWTDQVGLPCAVLTADCLPLLFYAPPTTTYPAKVAAAHAGWRGLLAGIIQNTLVTLAANPDELLVWLGPAIGPTAFEVGDEVRSAYLAKNTSYANAFVPSSRVGYWLADLYQLARNVLHSAGVTQIYGGEYCTFSEPDRFFSYRRDETTGRMASIIQLV